MICAEVVQRLPWLLNGTLPPAEQGDVRDHLASCAACRAALAETRSAYRIFTAHVPAAALVDYAWGQVPERLDIGLIERHLEECPECAAELELIRTSRQLADEPQIALLRPPAGIAPAPALATLHRERPRRAWQTSALAAALGGVIALTGWIHSERENRNIQASIRSAQELVGEAKSEAARIKEQLDLLKTQNVRAPTPVAAPLAPAPQPPSSAKPGAGPVLSASDQSVFLEPSDARGASRVRGGTEEGGIRVVALRPGKVIFTLASSDTVDIPLAKKYAVQIRRAATDKPLGPLLEIARHEDGSFMPIVEFAGRKDERGKYLLVLYGLDGGRRTELARFDFEVVAR
ncbi:MAG TPA: zf-HC2 domain-containing protein [Thermoanaerobaculia bacterium]|nr:zf-HC2 domain-containing protein [Thermoanaerobaculia bacterium]